MSTVSTTPTESAPTALSRSAAYEELIEAFGGRGYRAEDVDGLTSAVRHALLERKPALVNCLIDPTAGTESGHLQSLNPKAK